MSYDNGRCMANERFLHLAAFLTILSRSGALSVVKDFKGPAPSTAMDLIDITPYIQNNHEQNLLLEGSDSCKLRCNSAPLVGGYHQAELDNPDLERLATLVQKKWIQQDWSSTNYTFCTKEDAKLLNSKIAIVAACSQVVAGMNYAFTAEAQYDCQPLPLQEKDLIATDIFSLLAIGHQPLGDTSPEVLLLEPFGYQGSKHSLHENSSRGYIADP